MAVIVQPKRLLVTEFQDDRLLSKFIKLNTITDLDMYFNISKEWLAVYETMHEGQPVMSIPRRFPIDLLEKYAVMDKVIKVQGFTPHITRNIENPFSPKDKEQAKIVNFLLGHGEYANIRKKPRRALFAETGAGKTFSTLKAIAEDSHFAFINCPDDKAILTWKQEIAKFTNITPEEIGVIQGRQSIAKLIKNRDKYKVILGSSKTFSALIIDQRFDLIEEFFTEMAFSLTVHDEAHLNIIVLFMLEMITNTKRTFYLTATPGRRIYREAKVLENLMPSEDCIYIPEIVPRFEVRLCKYHTNPEKAEHVKGLNAPRAFNYLNYSKNYLFDAHKPYMAKYLNEVLLKVIRAARKAIKDKTNHKVAIVCRTKNENEILYAVLKKEFPDLSIGLFNSDIEDMDIRFQQTEAQLILTTDKSFAGIVNIVDLSAIILLHPITSEQHLLQIVGRIRKQPDKRYLVYILADGSFSRCSRALTSAGNVLEPHSIDVNKVTLNDKREVKVSIGDIGDDD